MVLNKNEEIKQQTSDEPTSEAKKNVYALSLAAFFNDTGSDMLTPVYSNYLTNILLIPQWIIGLLDSFSRLFGALISPLSGRVSDRKGRKIFIWMGYILLIISRATQALAQTWSHLIGPKILYELGRGIRNPARTAMITDDVGSNKRGWAFGLLQAADSTGAVLGPTLGYLFFLLMTSVGHWSLKFSNQMLLVIAAIPTIFSILIILFLVKDKHREKKATQLNINSNNTSNNIEKLKPIEKESIDKKSFIFFIIVVTILSLAIPTETLLLSLNQARYNYELDDNFVIFFFFNVFYALAAYPVGVISDKLGGRKTFSASLIFLILYGILSIFNFNGNIFYTIVTLVIFGFFQGSIFPPMMKLITNLLPLSRKAELIGVFNMFKTGAEIVSPLLLAGLFNISSSTPYLPYIFISIIGTIVFILMLFAPRSLKS